MFALCDVQDSFDKVRYCTRCQAYKPPRSHHCKFVLVLSTHFVVVLSSHDSRIALKMQGLWTVHTSPRPPLPLGRLMHWLLQPQVLCSLSVLCWGRPLGVNNPAHCRPLPSSFGLSSSFHCSCFFVSLSFAMNSQARGTHLQWSFFKSSSLLSLHPLPSLLVCVPFHFILFHFFFNHCFVARQSRCSFLSSQLFSATKPHWKTRSTTACVTETLILSTLSMLVLLRTSANSWEIQSLSGSSLVHFHALQRLVFPSRSERRLQHQWFNCFCIPNKSLF